MQWLNEPPHWTEKDGVMTVTAAPHTDFWRKTHDGGIRDNGHFYGEPVSGDFTAEVKVGGQYAALYDQAGLMVRLDEATWIKCGIEYFHDMQHVSAVVTRDYSDWSIVPLPQNPPAIWLRVVRQKHTIEVYYSLDGADYVMLRQCYFPPAEVVQVGLMVAAPTGDGFRVTFEGFGVQPGVRIG